jgi:hypothetical protein
MSCSGHSFDAFIQAWFRYLLYEDDLNSFHRPRLRIGPEVGITLTLLPLSMRALRLVSIFLLACVRSVADDCQCIPASYSAHALRSPLASILTRVSACVVSCVCAQATKAFGGLDEHTRTLYFAPIPIG